MLIVSSVDGITQQLADWRQNKFTIALVPTMGNLHAGHLSLVKKAAALADKVIVTIYVNPTQFVQGEDYSSYPRTMDQDVSLLEEYKVDLLFTPDNSTMYFPDQDYQTQVTVPNLDNILCGQHRPGHFAGVATIVTKLFNLLRPDFAVFGEKDYQQLHVIRLLARDLFIPIKIIGMPTVREQDGLALSSRNSYLKADERKTACGLYRILSSMAENIKQGDENYPKLEEKAVRELKKTGFRPDYVAVRDAQTLGVPGKGAIVVLAAATIGTARLIDNIVIDR